MAKILWLSHMIPHPPKGGGLQRSYHLLRAAAAAHEVDLVAFRHRAVHPDEESLRISCAALRDFVEVQAVVDLPTDRSRSAKTRRLLTSALTPSPYTIRWNASARMNEHLRTLRGRSYELVHFDTVGMFQYRHHFPRAAKILNHQNIESHMMLRRAHHAKGPLRMYLKWEAVRLWAWERRHGRDAHAHLVVSHLDRERLQEVLPDSCIHVVENPVDTDYFRPRASAARPGHVIFVGRTDAYTNLGAVRWLRDEIWPRLLKGGLARSLSIVGGNPPPDIVAWGRSDPTVTVTGFVDDVRPWLAEAEVFICPIYDGGGTRLKILDAMAAGIPVVSTMMALEGLNPEVARHVATGDDAQALAHAVETLLKDGALRTSLGRSARERVEALYSTSAVGRQLQEAYVRGLERLHATR